MLIDEAFITVEAGRGGDGMVSFFPHKSGPSGGNGGKGGNVYVRANRSMTSLFNYSRKHLFSAQAGGAGGTFQKTGADAPDLYLEFPVGTEPTDYESGAKIELLNDADAHLVYVGGRGGYGNEYFKSSTNQTPRHAEKGFPGQRRQFKVVMRLIADVGLIGLPNAGKSSLLAELTSARPKIAPYPFTTLEPNLGALQSGRIIADIPGLIEGASSGKGLGTKFLKHVEKVRVLLHCIACDQPFIEIKKQYLTVRKELKAFNENLLSKKEIILLTKSDLIRPQDRKKKVLAFSKIHSEVYIISVHDAEALNLLKNTLTDLSP